jgi:F-type H+-transporting ATPase subunit gamma
MTTPREIRRRIRSVKNIVKVTGALEAVSASKVRKAQNQVLATRAYSGAALEIIRDVAAHHGGSSSHPLLDRRATVKSIGIVLITSDRGLSGPYTTNIVREASQFAGKQDVPVQYITIGRKGRDLMFRRGAAIVAEFSDLPAAPSILDVTPITRTVIDDFLNGVVDEVYIAYTGYVNTLQQEPRIVRFLPLVSAEMGQPAIQPEGRPGPEAVYSFEPNAQTILDEILPRLTEIQLYQAVLESLASEHSARMVAMRSATENGNALADDLTLSYNKARQLAITSEMLDIVGGAEALAQSE